MKFLRRKFPFLSFLGLKLIECHFFIFFNFFRLQKKVVITSHNGKNISDSGKYVGEFLAKKGFQIIYLVNNPEQFPNENKTLVKQKSFKGLYELATAKIWIDNHRKIFRTPKRKRQYYIQTWHSPLRLKLIEKDAEKFLDKFYIYFAKNDASVTDYMISGCDYSRKIYEKSFWFNGEVLEIGTPRLDIFFKDNKNIKEKVINEFNLSSENKICLYMPTFRKDKGTDVYKFNYEKFLKNLSGDDWILLVKLHPNMIENSDFITYNEKIIDATHYSDSQELILACDYLLSDYSSVVFDALYANKPCGMYIPDFVDYISNDRPLYFDFNELPFDKFYSKNELENTKEILLNSVYGTNREEFLTKIGNYENGRATEKLAEFVEELLNER